MIKYFLLYNIESEWKRKKKIDGSTKWKDIKFGYNLPVKGTLVQKTKTRDKVLVGGWANLIDWSLPVPSFASQCVSVVF